MVPPVTDLNPALRGALEAKAGPQEEGVEPQRHRTLFISDVHLGTAAAGRTCWWTS
jgi:hypothetical protein